MNESKKMMEIIHENCKKQRIARIEKEEEKKASRNMKILLAIGIAMVLTVTTLLISFNEREIKDCMKAGHSENFCRYDGE